ncbi:hypothetical protein CANDROIZ_10031 [Candidatus Roizmanbacteria bacterium]|nr:hypothetical protein CANDROIZ_10031 [Candidatus Roizmanbacteria bacterium]
MNKSLITLIIIVILATIMYIISGFPQPQIITCTKETFICADGSTVRRSGPKCRFTACPKITKEELTATPSAFLTPTDKILR